MKIGIITFQCSHNYGAVLQAYGMQEYLKIQGHEVYIINYRPKYKTKMYAKYSIWHWTSKNPYKCICRIINEIKIKPFRIKRWNAFEQFRNNYFSLFPYKKNYNYQDFDAIILGSDQIWNPNLTGGKFDGLFWGEMIKCKVFSYAASTKKFGYSEKEFDYIKNHLHKLCAIGVREESLRQLLQPICSQRIVTVLDPTLLAGESVFKKISIKPIKTNYLLLYEIKRHKNTQIIAKEIAKKMNLQIVELVNAPLLPNDMIHQTASPEEFVGYFENASFVVTTSFHGLAFSFLFKRNFYVVKQNTVSDDRLISLLNMLGLENRFIEKLDDINNLIIDYSLAEKKYTLQTSISEEFVTTSLIKE